MTEYAFLVFAHLIQRTYFDVVDVILFENKGGVVKRCLRKKLGRHTHDDDGLRVIVYRTAHNKFNILANIPIYYSEFFEV